MVRTETNLHFELLQNNVATIHNRIPVVGVGSNASPAVMRGKMYRGGADPVIPMARATLRNLTIGVSAHVGRPGFLPATPAPSPDAFSNVVVSWLDPVQLALLDKTEPNYRRMALRSVEYPLKLIDSGELLEEYCIYVSRWGILTENGVPIPLRDQVQLSEWLAELGLSPWSEMDASAASARLARDEALRLELKDEFKRRRMVTPSAIDGDVDRVPVYNEIGSSWESEQPKTSLMCRNTADDLHRGGDFCVVVSPVDAAARALEGYAVVSTPVYEGRPGVVARVVIDPQQQGSVVAVDQVLRNALGVEPHEPVRLAPVLKPRRRLLDRLIARPHYVICRVQQADLVTVEQTDVMMAPVALQLLGIPSGAPVVIEGVPSGSSRTVPEVASRAHPTPDDLTARREALAGGGFESRFPASRDALAVYPDLPWIFLDSAQRRVLGLGDHKIAAVRVRASLAHQLYAEIRELMLVLVLAVLGISTVLESIVAVVGVLLLVVLLALVTVRLRLRSRLGAAASIRR